MHSPRNISCGRRNHCTTLGISATLSSRLRSRWFATHKIVHPGAEHDSALDEQGLRQRVRPSNADKGSRNRPTIAIDNDNKAGRGHVKQRSEARVGRGRGQGRRTRAARKATWHATSARARQHRRRTPQLGPRDKRRQRARKQTLRQPAEPLVPVTSVRKNGRRRTRCWKNEFLMARGEGSWPQGS